MVVPFADNGRYGFDPLQLSGDVSDVDDYPAAVGDGRVRFVNIGEDDFSFVAVEDRTAVGVAANYTISSGGTRIVSRSFETVTAGILSDRAVAGQENSLRRGGRGVRNRIPSENAGLSEYVNL